MSSSVTSMIKTLIQQHKIMLFTKSTCPYSSKVKHLFSNILKVPYHYEDLDLKIVNDEGKKIQQELTSLTNGHKTVPYVFIHEKFIGGCDKTFELYESGELSKFIA